MQSHAISQNDLMVAVASVDTEGSATPLVHSHAIAAVGLWDGTDERSLEAARRSGGREVGAPEVSLSFAAWYLPKMSWAHLALAVVCVALFSTILVDDNHQHALFCATGCICVVSVGLACWEPTLPMWPYLANLRHAVRATSPFMMAVSCYLVCVMLYNHTLPSEVIAAQARSRLSRHLLAIAFSYFAAGCLVALEPTQTRAQRWQRLCAFALFGLSAAQICTADAQPLEMLHLCLTVATVPFALGMMMMRQHEELFRRMYRDMFFAKLEARYTNAHAAAERHRAWTLEVARREMLVARASAQTRQRRRNVPRSLTSASKMPPLMTEVVQEEGYMSPPET